jgi:hypothetical protein
MDRENQLNCIAAAGKRHQNLSASLVTPFKCPDFYAETILIFGFKISAVAVRSCSKL